MQSLCEIMISISIAKGVRSGYDAMRRKKNRKTGLGRNKIAGNMMFHRICADVVDSDWIIKCECIEVIYSWSGSDPPPLN